MGEGKLISLLLLGQHPRPPRPPARGPMRAEVLSDKQAPPTFWPRRRRCRWENRQAPMRGQSIHQGPNNALGPMMGDPTLDDGPDKLHFPHRSPQQDWV